MKKLTESRGYKDCGSPSLCVFGTLSEIERGSCRPDLRNMLTRSCLHPPSLQHQAHYEISQKSLKSFALSRPQKANMYQEMKLATLWCCKPWNFFVSMTIANDSHCHCVGKTVWRSNRPTSSPCDESHLSNQQFSSWSQPGLKLLEAQISWPFKPHSPRFCHGVVSCNSDTRVVS